MQRWRSELNLTLRNLSDLTLLIILANSYLSLVVLLSNLWDLSDLVLAILVILVILWYLQMSLWIFPASGNTAKKRSETKVSFQENYKTLSIHPTRTTVFFTFTTTGQRWDRIRSVGVDSGGILRFSFGPGSGVGVNNLGKTGPGSGATFQFRQ